MQMKTTLRIVTSAILAAGLIAGAQAAPGGGGGKSGQAPKYGTAGADAEKQMVREERTERERKMEGAKAEGRQTTTRTEAQVRERNNEGGERKGDQPRNQEQKGPSDVAMERAANPEQSKGKQPWWKFWGTDATE